MPGLSPSGLPYHLPCPLLPPHPETLLSPLSIPLTLLPTLPALHQLSELDL